jgi:hypothetical protein
MNKISKNINSFMLDNPLEIVGDRMYQTIHFINPIYRAFANSYFWNNNPLLEPIHRNLGYYNPLQTDLSNYFKSQVIDWIVNKKNQNTLLDELGSIMSLSKETFINDLKKYFVKSSEALKAYTVDLYILSKIHNSVIYLYDNFDNIVGIFDNGIKYLSNIDNTTTFDISEYVDNNISRPSINIKYNINNFSFTNTPSIISSIYYR